MGHERVGMLPRTKRWRNIVSDINLAAVSPSQAGQIADRTLENVRKQYQNIMYDKGVISAFKFLVALAVCSKKQTPGAELRKLGITASDNPNPLSLTKAAHLWVQENQDSPEYARIAQYAVGDALAVWHQRNSKQLALLGMPETPYDIWSKAGNGAGFCEISRLFFAKFTERYLNFYLEREATAATASISERESVKQNIRNQVDVISQHAFETSKITQSFAAGWFNKHALDHVPDDQVIAGFLRHAFEKMREELKRESGSNVKLA